MGDFKILILAYLIGHSPIETQQTFQMEGWYKNMEECKKELLLQKPDGRYEVMNEFVIDEEFQLWPTYPKGKPKELEGIEFDVFELLI